MYVNGNAAYSRSNLRSLLDRGLGFAEDYQEALKWFRKAVQQQDKDAQNNLGVMYEHGSGVAQDYEEAVSWYRKAAEQGNTYAQSHLGAMYREGKGVLQDKLLAHMWFSVALSDEDESESDEVADLEAEMTPEEITEAESMAEVCIERNYKGC